MADGSTSAAPERVLVAIPTYNEAENIEEIVRRLRAAAPGVDVLVLDDGSPDGTGELADALAADDPQVHVMHRTAKEGLGKAYLAGFAWAFEHGYDAVCEMDADGSHQPEQLPSLIARLDDPDVSVVLGSRWVPGGRVENWPWHRLVLSRGGSLYARLALGLGVRDVTGGYRVYRCDALRPLVSDGIESAGYCFQIDLVRRAVAAGETVVEVPITFVERVRGESKMSGRIVQEAMLRVTVWGGQRVATGVRGLVGKGRAA
ncbi:polyprenol monophosphomannose synthase [Actinotalea sp. M2MS4P-6]|uniref:polyprenol monophosphomannose synthase n=1 Tax=Actinotalea sp. M2MS4P-6 TaxID=2983762 RepID=UPI0021E46411|nr:polyprenol monophosphomannose synthase [Actinotalea sp. M2MS4P-6]MCV2396354.1 polyprenol monophosphomannose synthase [Actinotalea sp. M2MS4P-6]